MHNSNKARNIVIIVICMIVLLIVITFSTFSTFDNITNEQLDVKITNVITHSLKGEAKNIKEPIFKNDEVSFEPEVTNPNDSINYDITVTNNSNINAYIDSISVEHSENISYKIKGLQEKDLILPHHTAILNLKIEYNESESPTASKLDVKFTYAKE